MTISEIVEQVDGLTLGEQIELKEYLEERIEARTRLPKVTRRRMWSAIAGIASYPLTGGDAQEWVTRSREEDETHRESTIRK